MFASALADFETKAATVLASPQTLGGSSAAVYEKLGSLWADLKQELTTLPEAERPAVPEDRTLDEEIEDAVCERLGRLFAQHKPTITVGTNTTKVPFRFGTSIKSAYGKHWAVREASRHAQAMIMQSPERRDPPEQQEQQQAPQSGGDPLVDALVARMQGFAADGTPGTGDPSPDSGKGSTGLGNSKAPAAVPPQLVDAASRITQLGVPALRCDRLAKDLALSMLQSATGGTFVSWAKDHGISGAAGRELATHSRALDLAVKDFGVSYLLSRPAEVVLRRMLSIALATKLGSYKLSSFLEELPGESALAELSDPVLKALKERMALELKLEALMKDKA